MKVTNDENIRKKVFVTRLIMLILDDACVEPFFVIKRFEISMTQKSRKNKGKKKHIHHKQKKY